MLGLEPAAVAEMSPETPTAVASVKVVKRNLAADDNRADEVREVRFWDKVRALERLARHSGCSSRRSSTASAATWRSGSRRRGGADV
jgi:hypothetical protein